MKRKTISALSAVLALLCVSGCSIKTPELKAEIKETETTAVQTTAPEATTDAPTTAAPTTIVSTTVKVTEKATKKVVEDEEETTKKKKTVIEEETTEKEKVDLSQYGSKVRYEDKTYTESLKYGVAVTKTVKIAYRVLINGKKEVLDETVEEASYIRVGYRASYEDLLPAARKNANKYSDYIDRVVEIVNGWRRKAGLKSLKLNSTLTEIANVRAEEVAWSGKHSHYRPNGSFFSSIFKENGYSSGSVGENLGWGYATPESVCEAWKNSPTHYKNIMNPDFTRIGVGVAADADPSRNLCWVQHFSGSSLG